MQLQTTYNVCISKLLSLLETSYPITNRVTHVRSSDWSNSIPVRFLRITIAAYCYVDALLKQLVFQLLKFIHQFRLDFTRRKHDL